LESISKGKQGIFFVLEGVNCSGKTSVGRDLCKNDFFEFVQMPCKELSVIEKFIEKQNEYSKLMFYYSGIFLVSNYAKYSSEALNIICDRYFYSTLVYHSFYNNCSINESLEMMNSINDKLLMPDIVFLLTITEDIWIERLKNTKNMANDNEKLFIKNPDCLAVLNNLYLELFDKLSNRTKYIQIDSSGCVEDTCKMILQYIHI
jgi:thymidylate kinase